jgi:hypothetical protein
MPGFLDSANAAATNWLRLLPRASALREAFFVKLGRDAHDELAAVFFADSPVGQGVTVGEHGLDPFFHDHAQLEWPGCEGVMFVTGEEAAA